MFQLYGKEKLYQWDLNQKLIVNCSCMEIHFSNLLSKEALIVEPYKEDGLTLVNIPNILLTEAYEIKAYVVENDCCNGCASFDVIKREKPADYIYTETEVKRYEDLEARISALEGAGITVDIPIERSVGVNALQQTLNREVFTVANENINDNADVVRDDDGNIISGAIGDYSTIFGGSAQAKGKRSLASGSNTVALGGYSHAEGNETFARGNNSHAEGLLTSALGDVSHAEGDSVIADGYAAHAEGNKTNAKGFASHSEGSQTHAIGVNAHAEGDHSFAQGDNSHAEGVSTYAHGRASHAEGETTSAYGKYSHTEGYYTSARSNYQHVQGKYNIEDSQDKYAHIIGNGESADALSNAHTVDWGGNAWFAGEVYIGGESQDDGKILATRAYVDELIGGAINGKY